MTAVTTAALAAALLLPWTTPAPDESLAGALDWVTEDRLADSVTPFDDGITQLEEEVTPVDSRSTDGDETVISLASDVLFDFGSAELPGAAREEIADLVTDVPQGATVQVHGHTDSVGGAEDNLTLSEDRAGTVAEVVGEARPDLRLEVEGFGEDEPVAPNERGGQDDPEGRALNRRVEIRFEG